jgi:hypothetical protein
MSDPQEDAPESSANRTAARLFDSAFEALDRLPHAQQQSMLREVMKRSLGYIPDALPRASKEVQIVGVKIKQPTLPEESSGRD